MQALLPFRASAIKSGLNPPFVARDQWRGKMRPEVCMLTWPRPWRLPDARYFQIAALATLQAVN
ncbi:MAG: hypothetical protein E6417_18360, partial [Bradyrhizobium sp.]|nr:hypothetical protein [Bradyrhizobium sp.]